MRKIILGIFVLGLALLAFNWKPLSRLYSEKFSAESLQAKHAPNAAEMALPTVELAIKDLFGLDPQTGAALTKRDELTRLWFNYSFELNGAIYYAVFLKTYRSNGDEATDASIVRCHACAPQISIVTYKIQGANWVKLAAQKYLGELGSWGDIETPRSFEFLHLSEKNRVLLIDTAWQGQGLNSWGKALFGFTEEKWSRLGTIETGGDNQDHCIAPTDKEEDRIELAYPCYSYVGQIQLLQTKPTDFPELSVIFSGFKPADNLQIKSAENQKYHYVKGKYVLKE